ncbi:hypothetical protein HanRHA438_Chr01g0012431 [Helianthus annuus]|nr:hypothetical protein HanRHA438_Chr01g0012431 [Helianthus annuus]
MYTAYIRYKHIIIITILKHFNYHHPKPPFTASVTIISNHQRLPCTATSAATQPPQQPSGRRPKRTPSPFLLHLFTIDLSTFFRSEISRTGS